MQPDGMYRGSAHATGGIPVTVDGKEPIEVEGLEYKICREAYDSDTVLDFGTATNKEILDYIHKEFSCTFVQAKADGGDFIICKKVVFDPTPKHRKGTVKQVLNEMQGEGGCKVVDEGQKKFEAGGKITDLTGTSLFFVQQMVNRKIQRFTLKKQNPKYEDQRNGIQEAIDKGYLTVNTNPIDKNEVWVRPTKKLSDGYFAVGGEIEPHKEVSASKTAALKEIAPRYGLSDMEAGILNSLPETPIDAYDYIEFGGYDFKNVRRKKAIGLKGTIILKLIEAGFIEQDNYLGNETLKLSDKAKKFKEAVAARVETRRGVKGGYDLFPEFANIPEYVKKEPALAPQNIATRIKIIEGMLKEQPDNVSLKTRLKLLGKMVLDEKKESLERELDEYGNEKTPPQELVDQLAGSRTKKKFVEAVMRGTCYGLPLEELYEVLGIKKEYGIEKNTELIKKYWKAGRERYLTNRAQSKKESDEFISNMHVENIMRMAEQANEEMEQQIAAAEKPATEEIVLRALVSPITDIGQLSSAEKAALNKAVKNGVLDKALGGEYPKLKMVYALKGFDFAAHRKAAVDFAMSIDAIESGRNVDQIKQQIQAEKPAPEIVYAYKAGDAVTFFGIDRKRETAIIRTPSTVNEGIQIWLTSKGYVAEDELLPSVFSAKKESIGGGYKAFKGLSGGTEYRVVFDDGEKYSTSSADNREDAIKEAMRHRLYQAKDFPKTKTIEKVNSKVDEMIDSIKEVANYQSERKENVMRHFQYDLKINFLAEHGLPKETIDDDNFKKAWSSGILSNSNQIGLNKVSPTHIYDAIKNPEPYIEIYEKVNEKYGSGASGYIKDTVLARAAVLQELEVLKMIDSISEKYLEKKSPAEPTPFEIDNKIVAIQHKYKDELERIIKMRKPARTDLIDWIKAPANKTKVIIAFSGGKDSIAMVLYSLFVLNIPKENIELWHHEVDGGGEKLFDWACTHSYCVAFAKAFGLKILFSYAKGGILREIYREKETIQPIYFQKEMDGEYFEILPVQAEKWKTTKRKFPQVGNDLNSRWCSWIAKIGVMNKAINHTEKYKNANLVIMTGERRLESTARSNYKEIEKYRGFTSTRRAVTWRPIIDWTDAEVWAIMEKHKVQPHPCYELGWSRCSCQICIFGKANVWKTIDEISPDKTKRVAEIEKDLNFTLYSKKSKGVVQNENIYEARVNKGKSFLTEEAKKRWLPEALGEFVSPVIVENWKMPLGATSNEISGAE